MKAIVVTDEAAGTAGMTLVERPEPPAAINDVIVRIHASGFVPTEMAWPSTWTDRRALDRTPSIPGHELAGVVSALGYGTTGLSVGQRVFGLADWHRDGTLADYVAVEARNLASLPGDVDFTVGASLPISGLTAWQGLFEHGRLRSGQTVLAHGAAGAVGTMVTQLAREAGAYVIGTGRAADRQKALDFGAMEFVDLENDALEDVGGVDLVFDVIGGEIQERSARLIRPGGTLVTVVGPPEARPADGLAVDFVVEADRVQLSEIVQRVRDGRLRTNIHNIETLRRCRCRLEPDRASQREDGHPRSAVGGGMASRGPAAAQPVSASPARLPHRRGLPAQVGAHLHRRRRPVHREEVQPGRTAVEQPTAEQRRVLDAQLADHVRTVRHREQLLAELLRDARPGHRRHPLDLTNVGDGHDPREDGRVSAARPHLVHQREVVIRAMEELREPEVGLPQLGCLVLPVGLTRRRRWMTFRVQRHPDAREARVTREPHQLNRVSQIPLGQLLGRGQRRIAVKGEQVVHSRAAIALHQVDQIRPAMRRAREMRKRQHRRVHESHDEIVRALPSRAAGAVGDGDEGRPQARQLVERRLQR
jgi:NADPH:quinone reductase-like Zn-dependent oxidoreductase